jgi:hypothetical protein
MNEDPDACPAGVKVAHWHTMAHVTASGAAIAP